MRRILIQLVTILSVALVLNLAIAWLGAMSDERGRDLRVDQVGGAPPRGMPEVVRVYSERMLRSDETLFDLCGASSDDFAWEPSDEIMVDLTIEALEYFESRAVQSTVDLHDWDVRSYHRFGWPFRALRFERFAWL